jgi:integrase/recombinase XerD
MANRKPKAPPGCYWRGDALYGRVKLKGRDLRWPLHTSDPKIARARQAAGKDRIVADAFHGDSPRTFVEAYEGWQKWIIRRVGPKTALRYACSLDQLRPFIETKRLTEITGNLTAEIIREREAAGVTNATIKRDLTALSSVINYAIDQGWMESNPVLARMKRVKERREAIVLPRASDIALVVSRAPGMVKNMVEVAITTGAREAELLAAVRDDVKHDHRQLTVLGKRNRRRSIDLDPFGGYDLICALPSNVGTSLLFWHSTGESYKNFASQFAAIVGRIAEWAKANGVDFRPFRFHDLRHLHAIEWLKSGRSIYELQHRLGHTSIKTTEHYLTAGYLTFEEQEKVKAGAQVAQRGAQVAIAGTRRA